MKASVAGTDIGQILDQIPEGVRYLSLDCFDTLLWRNVQAPADVFADLDIAGGAIEARATAERKARGIGHFTSGSGEVTLADIYARLLPNADATQLNAAIEAELAAEARHCYPFKPVRDLLLAAKARGLATMIVSDTYLTAEQLGALIAAAAGPEVRAAIDHIFVSCEQGAGKSGGMFRPVLAALGARADQILHIGDNERADQIAPAALGIHTVHLRQFDEPTMHRLRHEAIAATLLEPTTRRTRPALQPHRPLLSLSGETDPARKLGHDVLGPVLHSFATWLNQEADMLREAHGRPVKILFLMRDGYLPMKVFETLEQAPHAASVSISRLTATHASLHDGAAIEALILDELGKHKRDVLGALLMLSKQEVASLAGRDGTTDDLARAARAPEPVARICGRSKSFARRLIAHVRRAGVEPGDTIMFVDLGYNGTVQNRIDALLRTEFGSHVAGRYLLLREVGLTGLDKRGLFDSRNFDYEALRTLGSSVSILEQLCTSSAGSVRDYAQNGSPKLEHPSHAKRQNAIRGRVQDGAIAYGRAATAYGPTGARSDDDDARRSMAAAVLARFMNLPAADEVAVVGDFAHDVNLGTGQIMSMLDSDIALRGLRQIGLPYIERADRLFLSAELQPHNLLLNMSLFAIGRFNLDLRECDFHVGDLKIPVILANPREHCMIEVEAFPTFDGFFSMTIPAPRDLTVAVMFGQKYQIVELEDISFQEVKALDDPTAFPKVLTASHMADGMENVAANVYRCAPEGLLCVSPRVGGSDDQHALRVVFRPVAVREAPALRKAA